MGPTPASPPCRRPRSATTGAATNLLPDGAKLLGKVNAAGSVTNYHFEYGTTTAYGQSTAAGSAVGSVDENVSAVISALPPGDGLSLPPRGEQRRRHDPRIRPDADHPGAAGRARLDPGPGAGEERQGPGAAHLQGKRAGRVQRHAQAASTDPERHQVHPRQRRHGDLRLLRPAHRDDPGAAERKRRQGPRPVGRQTRSLRSPAPGVPTASSGST